MATTPSFYSPIQRQFALLDQIEALDGEMTEEIQALFSLNEGLIQTTTEQMLGLRDTVQMLIDTSELAIKREQLAKATNAKKLALLDRRLLDAVQIVGPISVGTRVVSIKKSLAVEILDAGLIPEHLRRTVDAVAEHQLPDGAKILAELRAGTFVPGARRDEREKLQVK